MNIENFKEDHKKLIDSYGGYIAVKRRLLEQKVYASLFWVQKRCGVIGGK